MKGFLQYQLILVQIFYTNHRTSLIAPSNFYNIFIGNDNANQAMGNDGR